MRELTLARQLRELQAAQAQINGKETSAEGAGKGRGAPVDADAAAAAASKRMEEGPTPRRHAPYCTPRSTGHVRRSSPSARRAVERHIAWVLETLKF